MIYVPGVSDALDRVLGPRRGMIPKSELGPARGPFPESLGPTMPTRRSVAIAAAGGNRSAQDRTGGGDPYGSAGVSGAVAGAGGSGAAFGGVRIDLGRMIGAVLSHNLAGIASSVQTTQIAPEYAVGETPPATIDPTIPVSGVDTPVTLDAPVSDNRTTSADIGDPNLGGAIGASEGADPGMGGDIGGAAGAAAGADNAGAF